MANTSFSLLHIIRTMSGAYRDDHRTDGELLSCYAATHDETAFATLMVRHAPAVWSACKGILGNTEDVEEVCQCTFLALAQKAGKLRVTNTIGGWLHQVACQTALNTRRAARSREKLQGRLQRLVGLKASGKKSEDDIQETLHAEIAKLKEKLRVPLILHYLEGKTQAEVAELLGVSKQTVWNSLEKSKSILQTRLAKQGVAISAAGLGVVLAKVTASAAVPPGFIVKTMEAAADFRQDVLAGGLMKLVKEASKHTPAMTSWWKAGWLVATLCVGGLAAGVGGVAWEAGFFGVQVDAFAVDKKQDASERAAKENPKPTRLDIYGDPLPRHALARMGTTRLWTTPSFPAVFAWNNAVLAFSADGKTLASVGAPRQPVRTWDAATGRELRRFRKSGKNVGWAFPAFLPDGRTLVTANTDFSVDLWDMASGRLIRSYEKAKSQRAEISKHSQEQTTTEEEHPDNRGIQGLHISSDGKIRVVEVQTIVGRNKSNQQVLKYHAYVRDAAAGRLVRLQDPMESAPEAVAFSWDGKLIAAALRPVRGMSVDICLWDVETGKRVRRITIEADKGAPRPRACNVELFRLTFSPDGKTLAAMGQHWQIGSMFMCDLATGRQIRRLTAQEHGNNHAAAIAFSPDGKYLVGDPGVLWDATTGEKIRSFGWDVPTVEAAYSPTGKIVATQDGDGSIRLWNVADGSEIGPRPGPRGKILNIAYANSGKSLVGECAGTEHKTRWWDAGDGKELRQREITRWGWDDVFSPDGKMRIGQDYRQTLTGSGDGYLLSDLGTGKEIRFFRANWSPYSVLCLSQDGQKLSMIGEEGKTAHVWDVATGETQNLAVYGGDERFALFRMAFSPDNRILAASGEGATMNFWELATGQVAAWVSEKEIKAPRNKPTGAAKPKQPPGLGETISPVLFAPDGRTLVTVTASTSGGLLCALREVASGRKIHDMPFSFTQAERTPGVRCAFSPDSRLLAFSGASDWDCVVHLIDVATGMELGPLTGHRGRVNAVVFSTDGRTLTSCSDDATCLIWDMTGFGSRKKLGVASDQKSETRLSDAALEEAWENLERNPATAWRAVWDLVATPRQAIPLLLARMSPASRLTEPQRQQMDRWIADLNAEKFLVRQRAQDGINALGEAAIPWLQRALEGSPPLEVRRRLQGMLVRAKSHRVALRELRAMQVLESIGTHEAQKALKVFADGIAEAALTHEAKASLRRLATRP